MEVKTSDYYEFLQISRHADEETIHRVYRFLAARYHPDNATTGNTEMFEQLKTAYDVLSDPDRRSEYDAGFITEASNKPPLSNSVDFLDSMNGVARDSLRSQTGGDASAFGMHQADAGSDAYDRDFALGLLSMEQDSLYEIDQALKRIDDGSYGVCEISGKQIMKARLEALPFTRYTVECQAEIEKRNRYQRHQQPVTSLFGLSDEESDGEEEDTTSDSKDKD